MCVCVRARACAHGSRSFSFSLSFAHNVSCGLPGPGSDVGVVEATVIQAVGEELKVTQKGQALHHHSS